MRSVIDDKSALKRILFVGGHGAGKTTAIEALCGAGVVSGQTGISRIDQQSFGILQPADCYRLYLGEGNQVDLIELVNLAQLLSLYDKEPETIIGTVYLAKMNDSSALDQVLADLETFFQASLLNSLAVGITHTDSESYLGLERLRTSHMQKSLSLQPIFEVDARDPGEVSLLVQSLLYTRIYQSVA